jgi:hypothetical protein
MSGRMPFNPPFIDAPIALEPTMNPPRFDLVITGLLALVVLAAVVAASPDGRAAPTMRDDAASGAFDRLSLSSSAVLGQAPPAHSAAGKAEGANEAGDTADVDTESAAEPHGSSVGAATGVTGMAMGLGMGGMLMLMVWAMAMSWRTRARV